MTTAKREEDGEGMLHVCVFEGGEEHQDLWEGVSDRRRDKGRREKTTRVK